MEIIRENNKWIIKEKYKIITNRNKREDGTIYYFYTTQMSLGLLHFFGSDDYYSYKNNNKIYITPEKPVGYEFKKFKARVKFKKKNIRVIALNPKIFNLAGDINDKHLEFNLHLDEKDIITGKLGLLECKIV